MNKYDELIERAKRFTDTAIVGELINAVSELKKRPDVVYCKDCKYSGWYCFDMDEEERFACLDIEEDGFVRMATSADPNGYCSSGERKENAI